MSDYKLLIGSLSNDLFRVANLLHRGSQKGAERFFMESKRWTKELQNFSHKPYIQDIIKSLKNKKVVQEKDKEDLLMYGILLQNYALHLSE